MENAHRRAGANKFGKKCIMRSTYSPEYKEEKEMFLQKTSLVKECGNVTIRRVVSRECIEETDWTAVHDAHFPVIWLNQRYTNTKISDTNFDKCIITITNASDHIATRIYHIPLTDRGRSSNRLDSFLGRLRPLADLAVKS